MTHDAFSRCHPAVNFLFFVAALGCGMVIQRSEEHTSELQSQR